MKSKDVILVDLYNKQDVEMVLDYLRRKTRRTEDRERKAKDNAEHLRKTMMRKHGRSVA